MIKNSILVYFIIKTYSQQILDVHTFGKELQSNLQNDGVWKRIYIKDSKINI